MTLVFKNKRPKIRNMRLKELFLKNKPLSCCLLADVLPFVIAFLCMAFESHISQEWRNTIDSCFEYPLYISIICMIVANLYFIYQTKELLRYKIFFTFLFIVVFLPCYYLAYIVFMLINVLIFGDITEAFAVH